MGKVDKSIVEIAGPRRGAGLSDRCDDVSAPASLTAEIQPKYPADYSNSVRVYQRKGDVARKAYGCVRDVGADTRNETKLRDVVGDLTVGGPSEVQSIDESPCSPTEAKGAKNTMEAATVSMDGSRKGGKVGDED